MQSCKRKSFYITDDNKSRSFMLSLADMWDEWATPKTIRKAAKKVGISEEGLNFTDMQEEKFFKLKILWILKRPTSACTFLFHFITCFTKAPLKRISHVLEVRNSSAIDPYCNEKSLRLEEISGLLTVQKFKPKQLTKSSTRVTQIHG